MTVVDQCCGCVVMENCGNLRQVKSKATEFEFTKNITNHNSSRQTKRHHVSFEQSDAHQSITADGLLSLARIKKVLSCNCLLLSLTKR